MKQQATTLERTAPGPGALRRRRRWQRRGVGLLVPCVLLALWQAGSRLGLLDQRFLPAPSQILATGATLIGDGTLVGAFLTTLRRLIAGFAIGLVAGVAAGLALGLSRAARALLEPLLSALYTIPKLAILPLLLLIFGAGEIPLVALVAITVFFYMWLATMQAAMALDPGFQDAASVFGASRRQHLRHVVWPAVLPQIVGSVRIAWGVGVLVIIGAEFVNASTGLGALVWQSWSVFLADRMYVGIAVISLLGVGGMALVDAVGSVLTPWTAGGHDGPRRLRRAAVAVALLGVALVAAARAHPTAHQAAVATLQERKVDGLAPRPLAEPVHLRAASASLGPNLVPLMLAQQSGELARENLSVDLVTAQDSDSLPLLTRGDLDVVVGVPSAGFFNADFRRSLRPLGERADDRRRGRRRDLRTPRRADFAGVPLLGRSAPPQGRHAARPGRHAVVRDRPPPPRGRSRPEPGRVRPAAFHAGHLHRAEERLDRRGLARGADVDRSRRSARAWSTSADGRPTIGSTAVFFGPTLLERNREAGMALVRAHGADDRRLSPSRLGGRYGNRRGRRGARRDSRGAAPRDRLRLRPRARRAARAVRRIQRVFSRYPDCSRHPSRCPTSASWIAASPTWSSKTIPPEPASRPAALQRASWARVAAQPSGPIESPRSTRENSSGLADASTLDRRGIGSSWTSPVDHGSTRFSSSKAVLRPRGRSHCDPESMMSSLDVLKPEPCRNPRIRPRRALVGRNVPLNCDVNDPTGS